MSQQLVQKSTDSAFNSRAIFATALWLISVFMTVMCVFALREVIMWGVGILATGSRYMADYKIAATINLASMCGTIVLGLIAITVIIYHGEHVFHHASRPRTLQLLTRLVAIEAVILIPVALAFWV